MKTIKIFLTAAALLLPLSAGAQYSGQSGSTRVGSVSADDDLPAVKPQPRNKGLNSAVPLPGGGSRSAGKTQAAQTAAPARTLPAPGEDLNEAGGNRFGKLMMKSRVGAALSSLASLRSSLALYYGENEGIFPPTLQTLVPAQAESIPELNIPGYSKTNKVFIVKSLKGGDVRQVVMNTGGWLYIADKDSKLWGEVYIDSVRTYKGKPLYEY